MSFKNQIKNVAADFPGLIKPDRLELLNSQLLYLKAKGFENLVNNFLSERNNYTLIPFLFELYISRWILTIKNVKDVCYEPPNLSRPPDFTFKIGGISFQIEAKAIIQIINELVKKKIAKQINDRISSKTGNVLEIWLSEDIDPKELNNVVDWITDKATQLDVKDKRIYEVDDEILAWVKVIYQSEKPGGIGIEHIGGTYAGLAKEIDVNGIREKIKSKMKKTNKKFADCSNDNTYSFLFLTCDSRILMNKDILQEALYGSEAVEDYYVNEKIGYKRREILLNNGIWSQRVYSNVDAIFFFMPATDFLKDEFYPYIFPNHHNTEKLNKIPDPFKSMNPHYPPTMLVQRIFNHD